MDNNIKVVNGKDLDYCLVGLNKQNKQRYSWFNGLSSYIINHKPNQKPESKQHLDVLREQLLQTYFQKQPFKVSIGKGKWILYEAFNPAYNLREVLNDEVVIEFDTDNQKASWEGINFAAINLYNAGISFEIWDHGGKSPHLHVHNLPISNLNPQERAIFKKIFIRKYVPLEYLDCADISLTGIHLIAIEWAEHWKGCYGVKQLLHKFNPKENS